MRDSIISLSRRPTAHAVWFGELGVLFNQGTLLAVYRPAARTVEYNAHASTPQLRHVFQWAHELRTEAYPVPINVVGDSDSFNKNVIAEIAAVMDHLDRTFNPRPVSPAGQHVRDMRATLDVEREARNAQDDDPRFHNPDDWRDFGGV